MANFDDRLVPLLATLQRSRLVMLAAEVSGSLESEDGNEAPAGAEPFSLRRWENRDAQARAQLEVLDRIVTQRIKLELEVTERSRKLANEIDAGIGERRAGEFATVVVTDPATPTEPFESGSRAEDLLSEARLEAVSRFLGAWKLAVEKVRASIGEGET